MKSWRVRAVIRILMLVAKIVAEDEGMKKELDTLSSHLLYSAGARGEAAIQ